MLKKKIAILMMCAFSLVTFAEEKFGHINSSDLISSMPDKALIEKTINDLGAQWEKELLQMREEYNAKIKEYQEKQASMPDGIKQVKQSEIQEMEQRITTFQQTAYSDLQKKQQELFNPIIEKVKTAINEVAAENKFTYIFDLSSQSVLYTAPNTNDITPLVKKKLGIK